MTSSNGNIFHVEREITKASDAEFWRFLLSAPEQKVEQTFETPVIWDAFALIMASMLRIKYIQNKARHKPKFMEHTGWTQASMQQVTVSAN